MSWKKVHYDIPGHAHELTFSCYLNRPFLLNERFCRFLAASINQAREKHRFSVWAYVFMPDHVHVLLHPNNPEYSMVRILRGIKQSSSRKVLIYCRKNEPALLEQFRTPVAGKQFRFWQDGGGYDRNITSTPAIQAAIKYIHRNPVRSKLVSSPGEWYWSSFNDWQGAGDAVIPVDRDTVPILQINPK